MKNSDKRKKDVEAYDAWLKIQDRIESYKSADSDRIEKSVKYRKAFELKRERERELSMKSEMKDIDFEDFGEEEEDEEDYSMSSICEEVDSDNESLVVKWDILQKRIESFRISSDAGGWSCGSYISAEEEGKMELTYEMYYGTDSDYEY